MKRTLIEAARRYVNELLIALQYHYYHQYNHALEVMERAVYLAKEEGLSPADQEMLALAGLFHDTGFVIEYEKNEPIGAKIAANYLRSTLYPEDKVACIERMILATDPDYNTPADIYESIIKDADLDNLGREDFFDTNSNLRSELEAVKKIKILDPQWRH